MSEITKEQIKRLETVGIAIADSISDEYRALKKADADKSRKVQGALSFLQQMTDMLQKDGDQHAD